MVARRRGRRRNEAEKLRVKQVAEEVVVQDQVKEEDEKEMMLEDEMKMKVEDEEDIDIGREIVDTTSLLSELFRDIQSTKAARETVRDLPPSLHFTR